MKKYIKPETEINVISACKMMCTSPSLNDEVGSGEQLSKERDMDGIMDVFDGSWE